MINNGWDVILKDEMQKEYFKKLGIFVKSEYKTKTVFPPYENIFDALRFTDYEEVKVVVLGQDPYHGLGEAHGLSFSVKPGVDTPPSLLNMYKELRDDLGCFIPNNGYLVPWAKQGVLLLNTALTVRAHQANSHKGKGWEIFTDNIIKTLNLRDDPVIFILWGNNARKKKDFIDTSKHFVIESAHPSPLSASRGFFGSKPFSKTNEILISLGKAPIDWQIPNI
jgi:uracil-DNA glycosylase